MRRQAGDVAEEVSGQDVRGRAPGCRARGRGKERLLSSFVSDRWFPRTPGPRVQRVLPVVLALLITAYGALLRVDALVDLVQRLLARLGEMDHVAALPDLAPESSCC